MTVTPITNLKDFQTIINGDKPVIVDFWATWCGPCRMISPVLDKMSEDSDLSGIGFYKVDVDAVPDVSQEVGIRAMPTFIVFKDGNKVGELVGARTTDLENLIKQHK